MSVISQNWPVVLSSDKQTDAIILKEFAEFWKIPYSMVAANENRPMVISGNSGGIAKARNRTVILTPRGRDSAKEIADQYGLQFSTRNSVIKLPVKPDADVSIKTDTYEFSGASLEPVIRSAESVVLFKLRESEVYLLSLDIVEEYSKRVLTGFEENPSWKFRMASKLPFSYQAIPRFIRDRSFQTSNGVEEIDELRLGPVECVRTLFLASLVKALGPVPRVGFWKKGRRFAMAVTHDVESEKGLNKGAPALIEIEQSLGIKSTWNLPSERYPISSESLALIKKSGEIGAHDTKHDGRLVLLNFRSKIKRLQDCKDRLERLTNMPVSGFRAPLLQHSPELADAEAKAGFAYDSSCPSWEILSPTSLRPHGAGTVFPFEVSGILEIPVSLPQDHQLIRVAGQSPSEAVDLLLRYARWIKSVGGPCVFLIHPDYEFATEDTHEYRRLLENFASDPECDIVTMKELSDWWKLRTQVRWDISEGNQSLTRLNDSETSELETSIVTGYGSAGFTEIPHE